MVQQYKTHVLCILEGTLGAYFHACSSKLGELDRLQDRFCAKLGLADNEAFLEYNLAPLRLRRDISALGFLFKVAQCKAHPSIQRLFEMGDARTNYYTRLAARRHDMQLRDPCDGSQSDMLQR